ncbi:MAG TPA: relaxase/mobilization nuclease domain-containing protein [Mucilaginibacter sp.]|jgi:hypothetical protein|nr:relaxase/mobilization nuclease domain-containing protein [Mucilaginibacter sp.]
MIVKIFPQTEKSSQFPGVSYNTNKIDKFKGELMKVANFGPLQGLQQLRPEDYKNYLKMISATNKAVKYPQFHAVISAKGREYDKQTLALIAEQWLGAMGYGEQPYLLVYHKDTGHNHIHLVTTRVNKQGKKISDRFERIRAMQQMNMVLGIDEKHNAVTDLAKAMAYHFSTKAQFMMILESLGYVLQQQNEKLVIIKFGKRQGEVRLQAIEDGIKNNNPNEQRKFQLKALFHKYAAGFNTELVKKHGVYTSEFSACLKQKFGIDLIFHASGEKPPYGYTIIDHAEKHVFKGGEIISLKELLVLQKSGSFRKEETPLENDRQPNNDEISNEQREYYAAILRAALYNYPDLQQGLHHQGLTISFQGGDFYLHDPGNAAYFNTEDMLNANDHQAMVRQFSQYAEIDEEIFRQHVYVPEPYIAPDVDDEAINGRNRRRKKMARTNQR